MKIYGKWVFKTFFVLKYCNMITLIWLVFFNVKSSTMLYMRVVSIYLHNVHPKILAPSDIISTHTFIDLNFKVYEKINWTYSNLVSGRSYLLQPPICGEHNLIKVKPKSFKHNLHYPTTQMKSINHTKSYVSLKTWYICAWNLLGSIW